LLKDILPKTSEIVENLEYLDTPTEFFSHFSCAWDALRCQLLKLETRQTYTEFGNPSYEAFIADDWEKSLDLIEPSRSDDKALYDFVREEQIDFIRCRPVKYPISGYLKWEIENYKLASSRGEKIYFCNYAQVDEVLEINASHDFMVFDSSVAFIHDYDDEGTIRGGWVTRDISDIVKLQALFVFLKSNMRPYELFI